MRLLTARSWVRVPPPPSRHRDCACPANTNYPGPDGLYDSAHAVWLEIPMSKADMKAMTLEAVERSGLEDSYLRHIVTRGRGDLGLDPRKCPRPTVLLIVDTIRMWPEETYQRGLRVVTAGTPMPQREALSPRVKSLNYLPHI